MHYRIENYYAFEEPNAITTPVVNGNGVIDYPEQPLQSNFLVYNSSTMGLQHVDLDVANYETWNGTSVVIDTARQQQDIEYSRTPTMYPMPKQFIESNYAEGFYFEPNLTLIKALGYSKELSESEWASEFAKNVDIAGYNYDAKIKNRYMLKSFEWIKMYNKQLSESETTDEFEKIVYAPNVKGAPNYLGETVE